MNLKGYLLEESSDTVKVSLINHPGLKLNLHLLIQVYSAKLSRYHYELLSRHSTNHL